MCVYKYIYVYIYIYLSTCLRHIPPPCPRSSAAGFRCTVQVSGLVRRARAPSQPALLFTVGISSQTREPPLPPPSLFIPLLSGDERCDYMTTRFPLLSCSRFPVDTLVSLGAQYTETSNSRWRNANIVSLCAIASIVVSRDSLRLRDELTSHRSRIRSTNA